MTTPPDPPRSKGMTMIAAYRAQRLRERPVLRSSLRGAHAALRQSREKTLHPAPDAAEALHAPVEPVVSPDLARQAVAGVSVFANMVSAAAELLVAETMAAELAAEPAVHDAAPADAGSASAEPELSEAEAPEPAPPEAREASAPEPEPIDDPPLAEIGFGPGMIIRLSQIGLHSTNDLARCEVADLRAALGDISRLVDVETWIANARARMTRG